MNVRSIIYYITTGLVHPIIHGKWLINFFSIFNFMTGSPLKIDIEVKHWLRRYGVRIAIVTFVLTFVLHAGWSYFTNNFFPDQNPDTRTFCEDLPNMINYAIIVPAYTTIGICFLVFINGLRENLKKNGLVEAKVLEPEGKPKGINKLFLYIFLFLLASTGFTAGYSVELRKYSFRFWFEAEAIGGTKYFTFHGYYYLIMSLLLMMISIAVIIAHFEVFSIVLNIGRSIKKNINDPMKPNYGKVLTDRQKLIEMFSPLSSMYMLSKFLVIAYLMNMYTWKAQAPGFKGLLDFTIIALAVAGMAIVSYPRYHLQYFIYQIWEKHKKPEYPDIRTPVQIGFANLTDFIILGGAMFNLVLYVFSKFNIKIF